MARYLVSLRRDARLTQDELARRSGVSQTHISYLERHAATSTARIRAALAAVFDVSARALRFGPDERRGTARRRERRRGAAIEADV